MTLATKTLCSKFANIFKAGVLQGQKTAMECWFTASELKAAKEHLLNLIDLNTDRLHIIKLDPRQPVLHIGKHRDFEQQMGSFLFINIPRASLRKKKMP